MNAEGSYSVWLIPDAQSSANARLENEISYWASELDPPAPVFQPHVTLIGGISMAETDMIEKTEQLAKRLRKYFLSFADVSCGSSRHQCVYIQCNKDAYTMQAASLAQEIFEVPAAPYMPHCSLMYSDMSEERRAEVVTVARERLYGNAQGFQNLLVDTGFWASALHVFSTAGSDEMNWKEISTVPLADAAP